MNETEKAFEAWTVKAKVAGTFVVGLGGEWMKTAWLAACQWRAKRDATISTANVSMSCDAECHDHVAAIIKKDAGL